MKSKVHPTYKTKYRVANWPAYNRALVRRGDVTVWVSSEAIAAWTASRSGRRGGQRRYSDLAIETALTLRLIYHLPLRQAEGFLHALFGIMRLDLSVPDYTTLSRRSQHLRRRLRSPVPSDEGLHLVLDSTGLSLVGAGEWAAAKHGGRGRRGWRKLHRGVDQSGAILVHTLTEATGDDATTALDLLTAVEGPLVRITADAASDTVAVYETATARGATVVIPPARTANVSGHGPRSPARDRTITVVKQLGRRRWKKTSGYHRQSRVENTFFRYKSIIGDGRRAALMHGSRALGEPRSTSWPSWRQQVHDLDMKSSVHPKYKTQYHVGNWPAYDRALVQRGDITVWLAPDAIATWEAVGVGKRGGQRQYSALVHGSRALGEPRSTSWPS